MKLIRTEDAVGHVLCHDLTQIIKDQYKDARFRKGHVVTAGGHPGAALHGQGAPVRLGDDAGDAPRGRRRGAAAAPCAPTTNMERSGVKEGKIELKAACDGLFRVRSEALRAVNAIDELMIATRKGGTAVQKGRQAGGDAGDPPGHRGGEAATPPKPPPGTTPCWSCGPGCGRPPPSWPPAAR